MGARVGLLVILVAALNAPSAVASDPFYEQVCVTEDTCYGAGSCFDATAAYVCVPRGCSVGISCTAEIGPDSTQCAFNTTIDGRTCAVYVGFGVDGTDNNVAFAAQVSNGSVEASPLENTWLSPGVESRVMLAGADFGHFYAQAYRSDIVTEGPRGGVFGRLSPSANHTWTQIGVGAGHHGGPAFGEDLVVVVELMDMMPEGCWVRSPTNALPEIDCPRMGPVYSLLPLP